MLFHPDPERFVTGAFVKIGFFRTNADLLYHDEIHGDLFTQVDKTMDLLFTKYLKAGISYRGIQRVETLPVPEAGLARGRAERGHPQGLFLGTPIQISVYADKLMLWNPGQLAARLDRGQTQSETLLAAFQSRYRQRFFRAGQIEAWGRGIERILEACRQAGCQEPAFDYETTGLWLNFNFPEEVADTDWGRKLGKNWGEN